MKLQPLFAKLPYSRLEGHLEVGDGEALCAVFLLGADIDVDCRGGHGVRGDLLVLKRFGESAKWMDMKYRVNQKNVIHS